MLQAKGTRVLQVTLSVCTLCMNFYNFIIQKLTYCDGPTFHQEPFMWGNEAVHPTRLLAIEPINLADKYRLRPIR